MAHADAEKYREQFDDVWEDVDLTWRTVPALAFWSVVYGTLALLAVGIWAVTRVVVWPYRLAAWAWGQLSAFVENVREARFYADDFLLPSIRDLLNWFIRLVPEALGLRDTKPYDQVKANVIFSMFWFLTSAVSGGLTLALVGIHVMLLLVGVWRWFPAVNDLWDRFRDALPVKDDYNILFWRSE